MVVHAADVRSVSAPPVSSKAAGSGQFAIRIVESASRDRSDRRRVGQAHRARRRGTSESIVKLLPIRAGNRLPFRVKGILREQLNARHWACSGRARPRRLCARSRQVAEQRLARNRPFRPARQGCMRGTSLPVQRGCSQEESARLSYAPSCWVTSLSGPIDCTSRMLLTAARPVEERKKFIADWHLGRVAGSNRAHGISSKPAHWWVQRSLAVWPHVRRCRAARVPAEMERLLG